jgi:hypothetical protein
MPVQYNPTPIDFSALAGIGQNIGQGYQRRALANDMQGAIGPDGTIDYNKAISVLMQRNPIAAMKLMSDQQGQDRFGLNPVFDEEGNAYQTSGAGGVAPLTLPNGKKLTAPQRWLETPEGYVPAPTRGPIGGSAPQPHPVQTMDVGPDGIETPHAPAAIPSLKSVKQGHEMASNKATDRALATNTIDKLNHQIEQFETLVDKSGKSTPALQSITGTRKVFGIDTTIPNDWLKDYSTEARDAAAKMATSAIQVGLNTLEQMRAMSAQGASGMGQLAIQESVWLQNSIASLSTAQSPEQAAEHIQDIINRSKRVQQVVAAKYKEIYGEDIPLDSPDPVGAQVNPPAPSGDVNGDGIIDAKDYFGQ